MVERTLPKPDTRVRFPSAAPQAPDLIGSGLYFLGWMRWLGSVGRVEAVCSLLLQGTRPRFASDTLMSRRNIPASPLLTPSPSPGRWSSGCDRALGNEPRGLGLGRVCGNGEGEYSGEVPQKLAGRRRLVAGYGGGSVGTSARLSEGSSRQGLL